VNWIVGAGGGVVSMVSVWVAGVETLPARSLAVTDRGGLPGAAVAMKFDFTDQ